MAIALLGYVPPVVGLYMAFFPVLIYFFLRTFHHNSMRTFPVVCLITGKVVLEHSDPSYFMKSLKINTMSENPVIESVHPVEVAATVIHCSLVSASNWDFLRLGIVNNLFSETLVSGFTTGASFQVIASQIKDLLGLKIPKQKGLFVFTNVSTSRIKHLQVFTKRF
ncbi:chloride anion exchanger-like [Tribolium madens]|uniref:chloride anion exchanger-like n=1 Tax=Tribolium madens TaxID=41895 RepID=UPI001CF73E9B|nr:chloride anion exchanger-like [Tribolium madens]XP_044258714.1 chloride anion exchanger-like [Tribolium madens]